MPADKMIALRYAPRTYPTPVEYEYILEGQCSRLPKEKPSELPLTDWYTLLSHYKISLDDILNAKELACEWFLINEK